MSLQLAIETAKADRQSRESGREVAAAYEEGHLVSHTICLYVIAALLDQLKAK